MINWKKIALVLTLIAAVHAVVIFVILPGKKAPEPEKVVRSARQESVPAQLPEVLPEVPVENVPSPEVPLPRPLDYRRPAALTPELAKRAARCRSGVVIDLATRRVLWSKNPRRPVPIASLTKLMTALLVMEKLENDPQYRWTSILPASRRAADVEPSKLGMKPGELFIIGELMQSMMLGSHNDSAMLLAESVSGDVDKFIAAMNRRGEELGFKSMKFNSPNGLPQGKKRENSLASAEDMTLLCERLMRYERLMTICSKSSIKLRTGKVVSTHNNLVRRNRVPGIIGFKTGYTRAAGFCLVFGVRRESRTILGCVTGFPSSRERDEFCRLLIEWSFKR